MEELADAIEDAQYVNAIASQDEGPRPVIRWETPEPDELQMWQAKYSSTTENTTAPPFSFEWTCQNPIGFFFFSSFVKDSKEVNDYPLINFCEEVLRYRFTKTKQGRLEKLVEIGNDFLGFQSQPKAITETTAESCEQQQQTQCCYQWNLPQRSEIAETYLCRASGTPVIDAETFESCCDYPINSESCIGLKGAIRQEVLKVVQEGAASLRWKPKDTSVDLPKAQSQHFTPQPFSSMVRSESTSRVTAPLTSSFPQGMTASLFDKAEALIMETLRRTHWEKFLESPEWLRCLQLLWYQDRPVVPNDFFIMRVLGRGGFGLVNGAFVLLSSTAVLLTSVLSSV